MRKLPVIIQPKDPSEAKQALVRALAPLIAEIHRSHLVAEAEAEGGDCGPGKVIPFPLPDCGKRR